ncbi:MAG: DNA repair exonuclease [Lachnospiraceae bacterium]|nr:DNA repair exonuclease [Lachnospiraceae bacterium]
MRIIHCADLHLESSLKGVLSGDKAKERREEILYNYDRLVDYANKMGVDVILMAGDIFDKTTNVKTATKHILEVMRDNPGIDFLMLRGNHDKRELFDDVRSVPKNVKLFNDRGWKAYEYGDIVIKGVELSENNYKDVAFNLVLDPGKCNIVMLHTDSASEKKDKEVYEINFNDLKNKNIDYLALGHIHRYDRQQLDDRGIYVYPGCLEGRGFDEVGKKGFVLLDIDENNRITDTFIPFAKREIYKEEVRVNPDDTMKDIIDKVHKVSDSIDSKDMLEIELVGNTNMDDLVDIDVRRIRREFADRFYCFKVKDSTTMQVDYDSFANDKSLKGEFIRLLEKQALSDEDKSIIVELGIKALKGENLDI